MKIRPWDLTGNISSRSSLGATRILPHRMQKRGTRAGRPQTRVVSVVTEFNPAHSWRYTEVHADWWRVSGLIHEKEAAVAVIHADSVDNGVDEEERASLLTSSV
jgi:hypothetical protein